MAPRRSLLLTLLLTVAVRQTAGRSKGQPMVGGAADAPEKRSCADIVGAAAAECPRSVAQAMSVAELQRVCDLKMMAMSTTKVVQELSDTACYAGYTAVHGTDACATSSSDACTTLACTGTASLWSIASPSTMCEYFAGDDVRAWEPDCAGSSAFSTAAEAALAGAPCEDGLQALVDDLTTVCNRVDNSWTTVRCVPTEEATEANVAACNAVAAPTSAGDCTAVAECEYLDPSTLKSVWEGWGCVDGTVAETACPVKCQAQIDHYYHVCESVSVWEDLKPENKRLTELIGCGGAAGPRQPQLATLAVVLAGSALAVWCR